MHPAADRLLPMLEARAKAIEVGPGDQPGVAMGPLITGEHRDRVAAYVERSAAAGATVVVDGHNLAERPEYFLGPCVLTDVTPDMHVYRDEVFGPLLAVLRTESLVDAVKLVNENPYGNGVSVFTSSGHTARWFQQHVNAGMVGINVPIPVPVAFHSFGGWKSSLFGDTHIYGPEGVRFYTRNQVTTARWPAPHLESAGIDLTFPAASGADAAR